MTWQNALPDNPEYVPDMEIVKDRLEMNSQQVNQGNLTGLEATLESQSIVLNYLFHQTAQLAYGYKFASESFE